MKTFEKGWSGGFTEFRYGQKKPITLPGVSIQKKELNRGRKASAVEKAAALAADWRYNRWEHEGSIRHGLREALCLQKWPWKDADDEAADIVRRAFNALGRGKETRPSEDEARDEYYVPVENCLWCYGELTEAQIAMRIRFCDPLHAKAAYYKRTYASGAYNSVYGKAAYQILYREKFEDRTCARDGCDHVFKAVDPNQKYCGKECLYEAQRIHYDPLECALDGCTEIFTPNYPDQRFCCQAHATASYRTVELLQCGRDGCDNWFKPSKTAGDRGGRQSQYCCRECSDIARSSRVHHLECQLCGDPFEAAMPNAVACCNWHYQILRKMAKGQPPKRLSAAIFDFLFYKGQKEAKAGLVSANDTPEITDHPVHRIFDAA